jgi:hypothetical protein
VFELTEDEIAAAMAFVVEAHVAYTPVLLNREWLREDFLMARYWRHDSRVLSDGRGGGEAPTVLRRAYFVRGAGFTTDLGLAAQQGPATSRRQTLQIALHKQTAAPVMANLAAKLQPGDATARRISAALKPATAQAFRKIAASRAAEQANGARKLTESKAVVQQLGNQKILGDQILRAVGVQRRVQVQPTPQPGRAPMAVRLQPNAVAAAMAARPTPRVAVADRPRVAAPAAARSRSGRPRVRVPARRGRTFLTLNGRIDLVGKIDPGEITLNLVREQNGSVVNEEAVALTRGNNRLTFSVKVGSTWLERRGRDTRQQRRFQLTHVVLRLGGGDVLDEQRFAIPGSNRTDTPVWTVRRQTAEFEMSSELEPTLMAYAIEILPQAPNPDESLIWL